MIHGQQTLVERDTSIHDFNKDKSNIIICNSRLGGVGIFLISPSWSGLDIIQVLGRTHRDNGKTSVLQKLIFSKDIVKERVCSRINDKINNISILNDRDIDSYHIDGLMNNLIHENDNITEEDIKKLKIGTSKTGSPKRISKRNRKGVKIIKIIRFILIYIIYFYFYMLLM